MANTIQHFLWQIQHFLWQKNLVSSPKYLFYGILVCFYGFYSKNIFSNRGSLVLKVAILLLPARWFKWYLSWLKNKILCGQMSSFVFRSSLLYYILSILHSNHWKVKKKKLDEKKIRLSTRIVHTMNPVQYGCYILPIGKQSCIIKTLINNLNFCKFHVPSLMERNFLKDNQKFHPHPHPNPHGYLISIYSIPHSQYVRFRIYIELIA